MAPFLKCRRQIQDPKWKGETNKQTGIKISEQMEQPTITSRLQKLALKHALTQAHEGWITHKQQTIAMEKAETLLQEPWESTLT